MNIQEAYNVMQENCGINVGDKVRILRKAKSCEMGWGNTYGQKMDELVGQIREVKAIGQRRDT